MAGNKDGQAITVRQFVVLRQIVKGKGKVLSGQVRQALAEVGVSVSLIGNRTLLKGLEKNGWVTGEVKSAEAGDGTTRDVNVWRATKAGLEVYNRTRTLLFGDKAKEQ